MEPTYRAATGEISEQVKALFWILYPSLRLVSLKVSVDQHLLLPGKQSGEHNSM